MSLLLTRRGARGGWDRRGNPSFVIDVARGGLSDMVRGAAITFTRASAAWAFDSSGVLRQYASGVPRIVPSPVNLMSVLREPQRTNKCTNYNANPNGSLTNLTKSGDAAATLTEVDDTAALTAAGLLSVCSSGKVFKLDNSAGVSSATVTAGGTTGNTNTHSVSVYARVGAGTGGYGFTSTPRMGSFAGAAFARYSGAGTPASSGQSLWVVADAGAVVYFILNQLEEGANATTPIVTAGSSVTRVRDQITFPYVLAAGASVSTFFDGTLNSDTSSPVLLGNNPGAGASAHSFIQAGLKGASYNGSVSLVTANSYTLNSRLRIASRSGPGGRALCLNGGTVASDSNTMPALASDTMRIGHYTNGSDTQAHVVYIHGVRMFASELTNAQLQAITS